MRKPRRKHSVRATVQILDLSKSGTSLEREFFAKEPRQGAQEDRHCHYRAWIVDMEEAIRHEGASDFMVTIRRDDRAVIINPGVSKQVGQHQIIEKLRTEFGNEVTSERQVIYILVEIGKLLEHENAKANFPTITFYRDWVVHTKLDHSPVADSLVRLFDDYVTSGNTAASDQLKALVSPLTLRQELTTYLARHHLEFPSCQDGVLWKQFVKYLAAVIDETPLHVSMRKLKIRPEHIETVTVSRSRNVNGTAMLTWDGHCHTAPAAGVETWIEVEMLPDFDNVALP